MRFFAVFFLDAFFGRRDRVRIRILHSHRYSKFFAVNPEVLEDNFPNVFRFTASVFPSTSDDVNTSPYNSLLASTKLIEHADCVLPIDNEALIRMVTQFSDAEDD
jgi:tubulin epsilon